MIIKAVLFFILSVGFIAGPSKKEETNNLKEITYAVDGMFCQKCANRIEKMMTSVDGVKSCTVNFDTKIAIIEYDLKKVTTEKIDETLAETGFSFKKSSD